MEGYTQGNKRTTFSWWLHQIAQLTIKLHFRIWAKMIHEKRQPHLGYNPEKLVDLKLPQNHIKSLVPPNKQTIYDLSTHNNLYNLPTQYKLFLFAFIKAISCIAPVSYGRPYQAALLSYEATQRKHQPHQQYNPKKTSSI